MSTGPDMTIIWYLQIKLSPQNNEIRIMSLVVPENFVLASKESIFLIKSENPNKNKDVERFSADVLAWKKGRNHRRLNPNAQTCKLFDDLKNLEVVVNKQRWAKYPSKLETNLIKKVRKNGLENPSFTGITPTR